MTINKMGQVNNHWGICGFTSSLYALHTHSNFAKQQKLEGGGDDPVRMLAEIKTYLRMLQADGRQDVLDGIEAFTKSFRSVDPIFGTWTINNYIQRINSVVQNGADTSDPMFGIAMPPSAVLDYLKRVCEFQNPQQVDLANNSQEMIIGMATNRLGLTMYDGLAHYLYSLNSTIYSWGSTYNDPFSAMASGVGYNARDWRIVCKIIL